MSRTAGQADNAGLTSDPSVQSGSSPADDSKMKKSAYGVIHQVLKKPFDSYLQIGYARSISQQMANVPNLLRIQMIATLQGVLAGWASKT